MLGRRQAPQPRVDVLRVHRLLQPRQLPTQVARPPEPPLEQPWLEPTVEVLDAAIVFGHPLRWTPNTGQPGRPVFVMVLPRSASREPQPDRPRQGFDSRATDGGDPRRRTRSKPSGPTPARERVHNP